MLFSVFFFGGGCSTGRRAFPPAVPDARQANLPLIDKKEMVEIQSSWIEDGIILLGRHSPPCKRSQVRFWKTQLASAELSNYAGSICLCRTHGSPIQTFGLPEILTRSDMKIERPHLLLNGRSTAPWSFKASQPACVMPCAVCLVDILR